MFYKNAMKRQSETCGQNYLKYKENGNIRQNPFSLKFKHSNFLRWYFQIIVCLNKHEYYAKIYDKVSRENI